MAGKKGISRRFTGWKSAITITINILMLLALFSGETNASIITVNASGGANFTRIQDAINAANNSDSIIVSPGIYYENVIVNKSVNLLGAGQDLTIVNALNPDTHVLYVREQTGINISGFTVRGGTGGGHTSRSAGLYLYSANNISIYNNNISNNFNGISVLLSSNNTIYNNIFNNSNNFENYSVSANRWNTTLQNITNIAGGSNIGGNFWGNPSGTGFSQTCYDWNIDGICNSIYMLSAGNADELPLSVPRGYINGSVNFNNTGIEGAIVAANSVISTTTDASGRYSLLVEKGSYYLTATSEPLFNPNSSVTVVINGGEVVLQNIELFKKPTGNISGVVSN